jgi:hypothetical protein
MLPSELANKTFFDSFSLKGNWWALGNAKRKVTGTLHIDPADEIRLEVDAVLRKEHRRLLLGPRSDDTTIWGCLDNGEPVSLFKCFYTMHDGVRTTYVVNYLVIGAHARSPRSLHFDSMHLEPAQIEELVGGNPFDSKWPEGTDRTWSITFTEPPPVSVNVPREKMRIEISAHGSTSFRRAASASMTYRYNLTLTPEQPLQWRRFRRYHGALQDLFALLTGDTLPTRVLGGTATYRITKPGIKNSKGKMERRTLRIFYAQVGQSKMRDINSFQMIFPLSAMKAQLEDVCQRWFGFHPFVTLRVWRLRTIGAATSRDGATVTRTLLIASGITRFCSRRKRLTSVSGALPGDSSNLRAARRRFPSTTTS